MGFACHHWAVRAGPRGGPGVWSSVRALIISTPLQVISRRSLVSNPHNDVCLRRRPWAHLFERSHAGSDVGWWRGTEDGRCETCARRTRWSSGDGDRHKGNKASGDTRGRRGTCCAGGAFCTTFTIRIHRCSRDVGSEPAATIPQPRRRQSQHCAVCALAETREHRRG